MNSLPWFLIFDFFPPPWGGGKSKIILPCISYSLKKTYCYFECLKINLIEYSFFLNNKIIISPTNIVYFQAVPFEVPNDKETYLTIWLNKKLQQYHWPLSNLLTCHNVYLTMLHVLIIKHNIENDRSQPWHWLELAVLA